MCGGRRVSYLRYRAEDEQHTDRTAMGHKSTKMCGRVRATSEDNFDRHRCDEGGSGRIDEDVPIQNGPRSAPIPIPTSKKKSIDKVLDRGAAARADAYKERMRKKTSSV
jgi:hypothetical protein